MVMDRILMTPGPTQVEPEVLAESSMPVLNHVSPEFDEIHREALDMLRRLLNAGQVILIPGSGTSAMELALRSLVREGNRYLILRTGHFGGYLEEGVRLLGGVPVSVEAETGKGFSGEDLARILDENPGIDAVLLQHVDTSTSVANPVKELAGVARRRGVRILVDAVASAGGMEIDVDGWGIDIVFTGSQKALSTPPGLGIVTYSTSYLAELEDRARSSLYFNIPKLLKEMESTKNYYITPAVTLVRALHKSLKNITSEGPRKRYERHKTLAKAVQRGLEAIGIKLVAAPGWRAHTVTAAYLPEGIEWPKLYNEARRRGIELAGGLGPLKGKIFRIGHMGQTSLNDVIATLAVVERSLARLGYELEMGASLAAAQEAIYSDNL